jgi:hypothetical protein
VLRALVALCLLPTLLPGTAPTAGAAPGPHEAEWTARWIACADGDPKAFGVYHFRRTFELAAVPSSFPVRVSADNRYELFANGRRVAAGPARGDLAHWRYETVDLAPALVAGRNVLAALVWNAGPDAPFAQVTDSSAFLLQGDGAARGLVETGTAWKALRDDAYRPLPVVPQKILYQYYVAGPGDRVDGARYPWGWERPAFDDAAWAPAREIAPAASRGAADDFSPWKLMPSALPPMEDRVERLARVRRASGVEVPAAFPAAPAAFAVPANATAVLLLDQSTLTTAYPELTVSGGRGATITLAYAETLFVPGTMRKGNRDEVDGKELRGLRDAFVADGGAARTFRPLWWRTYRYLELSVETAREPLTIDDLAGRFTAYPFERRARFDAGDPELDRILDVGWRTARLCAHETYMDCPYYEQLQYVGDTRVQALVSLYMSGDDRLVRNAIELVDDSRTAEGLTLSRAPSRQPQYIPPFSLWWIGMVHDYWRYRDDPAFVRRMLPGVRAVLAFFAARERDDGSLGRVPFWNFVDWTKDWQGGVPPGPNDVPSWSGKTAPVPDPESSSAALDLQLLLAYDWAADLEASIGIPQLEGPYRHAAERLRKTVRARYWDARRGLFADTPAHTTFSQQANALAVLAAVSTGDEARAVMTKALDDASLTRASVYFRYYLHQAAAAAGLGERYVDLLGDWRRMLADGLTTWEETIGDSRSDCHAWGSSPNVELFRTVLGIDSAAPGFATVLLRPSLGRLRRASGAVPHPKGEVSVSYEVDGAGRLRARVTLPGGVTGELVWHGHSHPLGAGKNELTVE